MARSAVYGPKESADTVGEVLETITHLNTLHHSDEETSKHISTLFCAIYINIKTIPVPEDLQADVGGEFVSCVHTAYRELLEKPRPKTGDYSIIKAHTKELLGTPLEQPLQYEYNRISQGFNMNTSEADVNVNAFRESLGALDQQM